MSSLDDLKDRLGERNVIPFIGAGVSMNVKNKDGKRAFPSWKEFLETAIAKLRSEDSDVKNAHATLANSSLNSSPADFLEAAKHARNGFGIGWNKFLDQQFNLDPTKIDDSSLEISRLIWRLNSQLVITTNFDNVLKWGSDNRATKLLNDERYQLGKMIAEGLPPHQTIWNLHGHISDPSGVILTPDGFSKLYPDDSNAKTEYEAALKTLHQLLGSYTFLFIGFSLNDAEFVNQIRYISTLFEGATRDHYALVKETDKDFINGLGLQVKPVTYTDHGPPLLELLLELVAVIGDSRSAEEIYTPPVHTADYSPEKRAFYVPFKQKGKDVIGRETDLQRVRESLLSGKATRIGQAISFEGMGGLGKTQLAVEYAYRYEKGYENGVIWITADQDIDKQLIDLAEKSQWIAPESESKDKLAVSQHRLKTITDCLIVFDNVELFSDIEPYLPESTEKVHLLATSRFDLDVFVPLPINLLSIDESVEMLEREAGRRITHEREQEVARNIAESLGRLPLALELAGAYLLKRGEDFSWQKYWDLLEKNPKSVFTNKDLKGSFTNHDADVYRTLKISETLLAEENYLEEILDLLTWSGSSSMGISLLCNLLGIGDETDLIGALALGVKLRFLQKSPNREAYAIHRLVAQVRQEDIPLEKRKEWVDIVCQRLGDWFQEKRDDFTKLTEYESEIEHLAAWQKRSQEYAPNHASRLLWLQAYPPYHLGKYKESYSLVEKAKQVYDATNCGNREVLAHIMQDFGVTTSFLGNTLSAVDYHKRALDIRLELFGEKHPDTAATYGNLGNDYGDLGRYEEGLEFTKKALDIRLELFGEKHPDTATSYGSLGGAHDYLGKYEEQLEFAKKALDIRLELFGERHPDTTISYGGLGRAYGNLGRYKEQLDFAKKALDIRLELFGEKHPNTANSYGSLGNAYGNLGRYEEQLEFTKKALDIRLELFGEKHPDTAVLYGDLGNAYGYLGRSEEFLEITKKALDIKLEVFGEKHPETAVSYGNLANAYAKIRKYDLAIEVGRKTVDMRRELLGRTHPITLLSVNNLINFFVYNTRRDKFVEMKANALALVNEYLQAVSTKNPEHENLLRARKWIIDSFQKKGFHTPKKKGRSKKHR